MCIVAKGHKNLLRVNFFCSHYAKYSRRKNYGQLEGGVNERINAFATLYWLFFQFSHSARIATNKVARTQTEVAENPLLNFPFQANAFYNDILMPAMAHKAFSALTHKHSATWLLIFPNIFQLLIIFVCSFSLFSRPLSFCCWNFPL